MNKNYLEQQFYCKDLFINEEYLDINYLPEDILHREQELIILSKIFIKLIENPFKITRKLLIQGDVGIGKTAIARTFGIMLKRSAEKRNIKIEVVHINCRKERTHFKILQQILLTLSYPVPKRGFSPQELMTILQEYLEKNKIYLFLVLDEMNHIQSSDYDLIYALTRLNDTTGKDSSFLSLLYIVRDITLLRNLDESTISTLQGNILSLKKYNKMQINDILEERINKSIQKGVFPSKLTMIISEKIEDSGDIRKGLNIVRNAVKIAEIKDKTIVSYDEIHQAIKNLIPSLQDDALGILNMHQTIILFSITTYFIENKEKRITLNQLNPYYLNTCKKYDQLPRKSTQIWQNLQQLRNLNLIKIVTISKNMKGRKSFCSINDIPLNILNEELNQKLKNFYCGR
ncbi:Cdc6/Cdc18 family protein [Candidatus Lokiarchaeum ossiferum]|uniref:Cdc6/Cdc18 family protein n=1 Tax=Candidatus Lokiarchaeum ossiferum TaxID=2951803 RepID=UPI00352E8462